MARRSEFVEHVLETLRPFGPVEARSMFGGWGLYHEGLFFALVAEDTLYLKVDDATRPEFEAAGLGPFVYAMKEGRKSVMSYYQAPEEALESPPVMAAWARKGYAAALRAAAAKKAPRSAAGKKAPRSSARKKPPAKRR